MPATREPLNAADAATDAAQNGVPAEQRPEGTPAPHPEGTRPTPASQWRKALEGELYELPGSGNIVRLRRPSLVAMAAADSVPNPLPAEILRHQAISTDRLADDTKKIADYRKNMSAYIRVAELCLVEPKLAVGRPPTDDEISPEMIPDADYIWLYVDFVEGKAATLAPFRRDNHPPAS